MKKRVILFICGLLSVFAVLSIYVYAVDFFESKTQIEVVFDEDSNFTDEQKAIITDYFQNHGDTPENDELSKGIICALLGHKIQTELVDVIIHKYYIAAPRCIRETYLVDLCTRCDYTESQLIGRSMINCCPED